MKQEQSSSKVSVFLPGREEPVEAEIVEEGEYILGKTADGSYFSGPLGEPPTAAELLEKGAQAEKVKTKKLIAATGEVTYECCLPEPPVELRSGASLPIFREWDKETVEGLLKMVPFGLYPQSSDVDKTAERKREDAARAIEAALTNLLTLWAAIRRKEADPTKICVVMAVASGEWKDAYCHLAGDPLTRIGLAELLLRRAKEDF